MRPKSGIYLKQRPTLVHFIFYSIWPNLNEHDKYLKLKTTDRFAVPKDVSYHFSLNEYLNRLIGSWPFFTLSDANYVW